MEGSIESLLLNLSVGDKGIPQRPIRAELQGRPINECAIRKYDFLLIIQWT